MYTDQGGPSLREKRTGTASGNCVPVRAGAGLGRSKPGNTPGEPQPCSLLPCGRGTVVPVAATARWHPKSIGVVFRLVQAAPDLAGRPTSLRAKHRKVEERKTPCCMMQKLLAGLASPSTPRLRKQACARHATKHRTLLAGGGQASAAFDREKSTSALSSLL